MKRLTGVLTAALLMAVIATGCSKDESENMENNETEQTQQDYFEEPILDFSLTLDQLKAKETHAFVYEGAWTPDADGPKDAAAPWFANYSYPTKDGALTTAYHWTDKEKGGIYSVSVDWSGLGMDARYAIRQQLVSRYGMSRPTSDIGVEKYYSATHKLSILETATSITYYPAE